MKNLFNKQEQGVFTRIVDKELEEHITKMDAQFIQTHKSTAQKLSVLDFKSMPKSNKISDFIGGITKDYQKLIDFCHTKLNRDIHSHKKDMHIADNNENLTDLDRQIQTVDDSLSPLKGNFSTAGKEHEPIVKKYYKILWILYFIAGIELIANFEIFSTLGGGIISSCGIGLLTATCIFWYAHFTPKMVKNYGGDSPRRQLLVFFLLLLPIVAIFYIFSSMRISYLTALNPEMAEIMTANPLTYTLINVFAYIISCWIVWEFKPSQHIINSYKRYKKEIFDIQKLESEKEILLKEKSSLTPKLRATLSDYYNVMLLGQQTEQEIQTKMEACFENFKLELYLKTNGQCASLFTGDIEKDLPKLSFNYQNITKNFTL